MCHFGDITISGNVETPDYLIRRQLTFKPGDVFSFKELYDSQRKLYALDLFQSVTIAPEEGKEKELPDSRGGGAPGKEEAVRQIGPGVWR